MFLRTLNLQHYRNYQHAEIETAHNVNIFIGPNAQGKTNLLEAIFVLALTRSHRTSKYKELMMWEQKNTHLHGEIEKKYGLLQLDLYLSQQGKMAKINGLEQRKLSDFIGQLNVVMFAPEDLEIVKGAPAIRRRFLDMEIGQVQPVYLHDLGQYQKILLQRNNFLKSIKPGSTINHDLLEVLNMQLAQTSVKIIKKRQSFITKLQVWAEKIHSGITNDRESLRIKYISTLEVNELEDEAMLFEQFMLKLSHVKEQEIRRGMTLVGPHRDDLAFYINDKEVFSFGSQGQQRTTALSLKLAELELIHEEVGEYPLLLLDDVLSELDRYRQTHLIETFQDKIQTFITTTSVESVNFSKLSSARLFHVENGTITTA